MLLATVEEVVAFCSSSPCSVRPVVLLMSAVAFICPFLGGGWRQDLQGRMSATAGGSVLGFFFFSVLGGWSGHGTTASVAPAVQGLLGGQCWPAGAEGAAARPPPLVLPLHRGRRAAGEGPSRAAAGPVLGPGRVSSPVLSMAAGGVRPVPPPRGAGRRGRRGVPGGAAASGDETPCSGEAAGGGSRDDQGEGHLGDITAF